MINSAQIGNIAFMATIIIIIAGLIAIAFDYDGMCISCQQAKANCPNGYIVNQFCDKGIYGYTCTDDGKYMIMMCGNSINSPQVQNNLVVVWLGVVAIGILSLFSWTSEKGGKP